MAYSRVTRTANGKGALEYAMGHTKGHNGHDQRNSMVGYVNLLSVIDPADQMQRYWNKARKNYKTQVLRIVQSFSLNELNPENEHDIWIANLVVQTFVQKYYPNRQAVVFTQIDGKSGLVHNHLIISDTDMEFAKGCTKEQYYFPKIKEWTNEIAGQYMTLDFGEQQAEDKRTQTERHKREVGEYVWKDDLKSRVKQAQEQSSSEQEWIAKLPEFGVNIEVHDSKKRGRYYTYELMDTSNFPEGKKIPANLKARSYKLRTLYDSESILEYFQAKEPVKMDVPKKKKSTQKRPGPAYVSTETQVDLFVPPRPVNRLHGEDDIEDMTDILDEQEDSYDEKMSIGLQQAMDREARKRRGKVQTRLEMVREDSSNITRIRSKDVVNRIRKAQDDRSMGE